jgi:NAD(P)-dependent dehydrogenase (short-subunit alcohol dehydrogenase family)
MINKFKDIIYNIFFKEEVIISSDNSLKGKVVVITGASKGIGRSTVQILVKRGATVVMVARNVNELRKTYSKNLNCLVIAGNVVSRKDCVKIARKTIESFGKIDVLINCAGLILGGAVENFSEKKFDLIMDTNIKGTFLMCSATLPFMKNRKKGLIINMGSKISHNTNVSPGKVIYAATKYAVEGFSYTLGKELKPFGIRISCLMPATINTFRSLDSGKYLSSYKLAEVISFLIKYDDIHFESIILKSVKQDI